MPSGSSVKIDGMWLWPKKQRLIPSARRCIWTKFRDASKSEKMYASSSSGEPWHTTNFSSTTEGPGASFFRKSAFSRERRSTVHRAASSAGGLKSAPSSTPETTLSWFPRIASVGRRNVR